MMASGLCFLVFIIESLSSHHTFIDPVILHKSSMPRRPNYPNATNMQDFTYRMRKVKENEMFPGVDDTIEPIKEISQLFSSKTMTPPNWAIATITCATSLCLSGSKVTVNAGHSCGTATWVNLCGISSSRKGSISTWYTKHIDSLNPYFQKYIGPDFQISIDGATLPAIQKQTQSNKGTLSVHYEEVGEFIKQFKLYEADGLRSKLLMIHDQREWKMDYKGKQNIHIPSTYWTMMISSQPATGTDFLNTLQEEGLSPRILTIFHSDVEYRSSKQLDESSQQWVNSNIDVDLHQTFVQIIFRFAIPHLQSDNKIEFFHMISEAAQELCRQIRDRCMQKWMRYHSTKPAIASIYGKMADKIIKVACIWCVFRQCHRFVKEGRLLEKPLCAYSEEELENIDPELKSQELQIGREELEQAHKWVEKNLLVDAALRTGHFVLEDEDFGIEPERTFFADYLLGMEHKIISNSFVHQWKRPKINGSRANAREVKEMHEYLSDINAGYTLMNGAFFSLHNVKNMKNMESVVEVLKAYQYIGLNQSDYGQIMQKNGTSLRRFVERCYEKTVVASKVATAKKRNSLITLEEIENVRDAAMIKFNDIWAELHQHLQEDKSELVQANSTTPCPTHSRLSSTFPENLNAYYQNWCDKIEKNATTSNSSVVPISEENVSINYSSQISSIFNDSSSNMEMSSNSVANNSLNRNTELSSYMDSSSNMDLSSNMRLSSTMYISSNAGSNMGEPAFKKRRIDRRFSSTF